MLTSTVMQTPGWACSAFLPYNWMYLVHWESVIYFRFVSCYLLGFQPIALLYPPLAVLGYSKSSERNRTSLAASSPLGGLGQRYTYSSTLQVPCCHAHGLSYPSLGFPRSIATLRPSLFHCEALALREASGKAGPGCSQDPFHLCWPPHTDDNAGVWENTHFHTPYVSHAADSLTYTH